MTNDIYKHVGVIGPGSFGVAIANILAENGHPTYILCRNTEQCELAKHRLEGKLHDDVMLIHDAAFMMQSCNYIFPIIPGKDFEQAILPISSMVEDRHIFTHGTKGLHLTDTLDNCSIEHVETMSMVMKRVLKTQKVACLAGPNLSREINEHKPAATVIASKDKSIQHAVGDILRSKRFQVLMNDDIYGIELCGVLKNIIAIAAGAASGLNVGENAKALLINRGLIEMIHIGSKLGASVKSFYGVAGMGDLMATCYSPNSRNFSVGYQLSQGLTYSTIRQQMEETAEGVNTTRLIYQLSEKYNWKTPITKMVYKALFEDYPAAEAIQHLMMLPVREDIDF